MQQVTIDYVTRAPTLLQWRIVLVEEGPWRPDEIEEHLQRVQNRLYACIDAALDGNLARQFPDSENKLLIIQLDCYDVPGPTIRTFFDRFTHGIRTLPGYKEALQGNPYICGLSFELTCNYSVVH